MDNLSALVSLGGHALADAEPDLDRLGRHVGARAAYDLGPLLRQRNGFYAYESALHVLSDADQPPHGLLWWNHHDLWRREYDGMADDLVFFAEDVFGHQFCLRDGVAFTFDPETGDLQAVGSDLDEWAGAVVREHKVRAGDPIARRWQQDRGRLRDGHRLSPKVPFVLGGAFDLDNLAETDAVASMRLRASVAVQIRDLPDDAQIRLDVTE